MAVIAVAEHEAGGLADLERELGRNDFVGPAANAVGAEIATRHRMPLDAQLTVLQPRNSRFIGGRRMPGSRQPL